MITINNYYTETANLKITDLPLTLWKGKEFVDKVTQNGKTWGAYHSSDSIKNTINLYITKLNEYVSANAKEKSSATPKKTARKTARTTKPKVSAKSAASITVIPKAKTARELAYEKATKVERISDELRMIKRFALMHDKVKTQNQIRLFINALQKAITEKRIRKSSEYSKEVIEIQDFLIKLHGRFRTENERIHVVIGDKKLSHYLTLVGKQAELLSVKFIKSYINLQGKSISNTKAKNLYNRIANAVNKGELSKKDRYWKEVDSIMSTLKSFVKKNAEQGELLVSSKELNGLQGIVAGCGCDELNGIQTDYRNTIMNSTDIVNLDFEKLGFKGKWFELIGNPSSGFTTMIFGKPKMGKSYLAVDFSGYLARNHGTVLYVAREEGIDDTLQQKLKDKNVAHPDLYVSDYLPEDLSAYDFVFLDSVNKLRLSPEQLDAFKRKYPETSFIYIFQTTKLGNFRGGNEFQHDVDSVIEVAEKGKAIQFGRFNQGGAIDIFDS
ncbi:MAG: hypothetical protein JKY09_08265 [Crocinitomicaceae bacterium]|nr:hypothetical protein [Crocinitomicaceae bacterium]